ncbi:MAG: glycosyltransferase family 4 protein [Phycisphaerales bacterium]
MRALLLQSAPTHAPDGSARVDHFAGVAQALRARGIDSDRALVPTARPSLPEGTGLVAVADCLGPMTRHALRLAREAGLPTLLLMDGLVEHRNTFENVRAGPGFLRPAPVHAVACAGEICADVLTELGNNAWATGLPRLDAIKPRPGVASGPLVVATANTPWFSASERERLTDALGLVRDGARALGIDVVWRLTGRCELELGVANDPRPLPELLAIAGGLMTTPSTLLAESMVAGVPSAVIDPHGSPIWHRGSAVWRAREPDAAEDLAALLPRLVRADEALLDDQRASLALTHPDDGRSAERVATVLADLAYEPPIEDAPVIVPLTSPSPDRPKIPGRPRVVNVVWTDGAPNGGVPVWCARMADWFALGDFAYDVRTLYLSPIAFENKDSHADVCVLPPDLDHAQRFAVALDALLAFEPDVVCAHYGDLPHMIATAARFRGVRSVAVLQTDDPASVATVRNYNSFDAAVGVSDACAQRLGAFAGDRPVRVIHDGVPIAEQPRDVGSGPIRVAYFGRMVDLQKRVSDLGVLAGELDALGVACEFHLVGDGPDLDGLLGSIRSLGLASVRVRAHGQRPAAWVEAFLPSIDISVLVSEFEGASITMMEAMGAGCVPCVTDVGSGVRELVTDGENGVIVPVGDMQTMANRIAALDADRSMLGRLGRRAWERARERAGVRAACERWRDLLDAVMAIDPVGAPTDAHLRPRDAYRWTKHWADDELGALRIVTGELRSAGFRRVVPCHAGEGPDPSADAVVLAGEVTPDRAALADRLRESGIGVALSPTLIEPEWCRLARAVERARDAGASRVAVFGAGDHTRRAARAFGLDLPIVGIIDDHPRAPTMLGVPLVRTDDAIGTLRPNAVVLSSDAWESALWAKSAPFRDAGLPVIPLYGTYREDAPARS